jgi:hypothetical protein
MNRRLVRVSVAVAAVLTAASACLAQELTPPPAPAPAAKPAVVMGAVPRTGSIGGMFGASAFYASGDYVKGAQPRMAFNASFRYTVTPWLRWQFSPGFAWAAYSHDEPAPFIDPAYPDQKDKEDHLTLVLPVTFQLHLLKPSGQWLYHVGGGPGLYRVWLENHRKVVKDPVTLEIHRQVYPGFSVEVGAAKYLKSLPAVSVEGAVTSHYVFSEDKKMFPSGYNTAVGVVEVRVGANYHFSLVAKPKKTGVDLTAPPPAKP